jgi:hypothetical protein
MQGAQQVAQPLAWSPRPLKPLGFFRFGADDLGEWASKGGEPVIHSDASSALALAGLLLFVVMLCSRG